MLVLFFNFGTTLSQQINWEKVGEIPIKNAVALSVDRKDQLFVSDTQGNIYQYGADGDSINFYSPVFRARPERLEAAWTVNIFIFTSDMQQAEILDRFLNPVSHIRFSQEGFGMVSQANLGNGNVLWLVDEAGLRLVKYDYRRKQKLQEQPLSLILPGRDLIALNLLERKNTLFLQVKDQGVFILDNQGNLIKHVPHISNSSISVEGNWIFFIDHEGQLGMADFVNNSNLEVKLPKTTYKNIAVGNKRVFLLHSEGVSIFEKPNFN